MIFPIDLLSLYIDPGTGSMLFSLFMALVAASAFGIRVIILKIKFFLSGGKTSKDNADNIPYLIFSDHKRYWNVFHGLCDEFEKNKVELTYYTASPDDPVFEQNYKYVHVKYLGEGNKPYATMNMVHADIVVATTPGLDVYQWKRSRYVKWYVHIPHTIRSLYSVRMFGFDHYDAILTSGPSQTATGLKIEELRINIPKKEYVEVGAPTMDNLYYQKLNMKQKNFDVKKTILVAPSWGKSGILSKYGKFFLEALEKTDYRVIIRPHPQSYVSEKSMLYSLMKDFDCFEWNFDNDNFNVLSQSDLLISDFSGTIFDFLLIFNKPILYTDVDFDTAPYDAAWLQEEMWEFEVLRKIGIKISNEDFPNIKGIIENTIRDNNLKDEIKKVQQECWINPGQSHKKCFDYLIEKHKILSNSWVF